MDGRRRNCPHVRVLGRQLRLLRSSYESSQLHTLVTLQKYGVPLLKGALAMQKHVVRSSVPSAPFMQLPTQGIELIPQISAVYRDRLLLLPHGTLKPTTMQTPQCTCNAKHVVRSSVRSAPVMQPKAPVHYQFLTGGQ